MQLSFDTPAADQPQSRTLFLLKRRAPAAMPMPALPMAMRRGETLAVDRPQLVICTEGALWITHDHDPKRPGSDLGERSSGRPVRMRVHAVTDARVEFVAL